MTQRENNENPNAVIDESRSITRLSGTPRGLGLLGETLFDHIKNNDWSDIELVAKNLELGAVTFPIYMVAYEKVEGNTMFFQ